MPQFIAENDFIMLPARFITDKLPKANPTFVKIYVYLAMLAQNSANIEYGEIANTLGLLESDLIAGINYWVGEGQLTLLGETVSLGKNNEDFSAVSESEKKSNQENIAEIITSNRDLQDMFLLVQEILGKTITENDMQTVYWFYSELKFPVEVILMLLEHCVSKGKTRMSYIEKVAVSWNEMGLNTPDSVTDYLKSEEQRTGFLYSMRKLMGISDRSLSQIEEKYLTKWHEEYKMEEEMVALAYEYCIIQTAKLSFPYMDKIITRWHNENITTVAEAEEDNKKFKNRAKSADTAFLENNFDGIDLERLSRGGTEK